MENPFICGSLFLKHFRRHSIFCLLLLIATFQSNAAEIRTETFKDQGVVRTFHLYVPDGLPADAPLVFVLHGYGGKASGYQPRFVELADEYGFAVCYPQGSVDSKGKTCWNVGYPWQIGTMKVDDCKFICRLARRLQKRYGFSTRNTFLCGMSNGGEMCYLMAYRKPEMFGAIASMAGLTLVDMIRRYDYEKPVAFMEVHGTADKTSRWDGDPVNQYGWGEYLAVPLAVGAVVAANGCIHEETTELPKIKNKVILHRYHGSPYGKEVLFYEVVGGGHNWATDSFDSCRAICEFFKKNRISTRIP